MNKYNFFLVLVSLLGLGSKIVWAETATQQTLTPIDQKNHAEFIKKLSAEQLNALSGVYTDFRILKLCAGNFSGSDQSELVLGIWKPVILKDGRNHDVHRLGLIRKGKAWEIHRIDDELKKGSESGGVYSYGWQYGFDKKGFSGDMKCGIESEFDDNSDSSDLTYALGDKPFFNLKEKGLAKNKLVCFATDDVYNNWDCAVYSPRDGRFLLWFQQAHAD